MNRFLTKLQKQELGNALLRAGESPADFIFKEDAKDDGQPFAHLVHRGSSDEATVEHTPSGLYRTTTTTPGTSRRQSYSPSSWLDTVRILESWAHAVKLENEAVDPWEQEAEDMANDDSFFTMEELPRVDRAIDDSLAELQQKATEAGKQQKVITAELKEVKLLLKKAARSSTKREWLSLFKGIIVEKLVSWGMQTQIFHEILHTLISSAQDIAQLAEHAARHFT